MPLGLDLVATHDMMAEGVHFTPDCPPADIGWKLVAVNLSDLAAMGAKPLGVLMGAGIGQARGADWAAELVRGMGQALDRHGVPLLGGDTIRSGPATIVSLTALGSVPPGAALDRRGARAGDQLWVSGAIGDAGLGLEVALGQRQGEKLLKRYRRPEPRLRLGMALRGVAMAAMDVSDGLLIDAARMAEASGLAVAIESRAIPVSEMALESGVPVSKLAAMGDDYELLFAAPAAAENAVRQAAQASATPVTRIGLFSAGEGLLLDGNLPEVLGYRHL